jgi:hypothetical protein
MNQKTADLPITLERFDYVVIVTQNQEEWDELLKALKPKLNFENSQNFLLILFSAAQVFI